MSDQILSQEEIDALLAAMSNGEVDLEQEGRAREPKVTAFDLTSQSVMLRSQFYALEEVNTRFAEMLGATLTESLQRPLEVGVVSSEMVKYGDFMKAFGSPGSYTIFTMEPLVGSALIVVEPELVFSLIDCMFGGDGKPYQLQRDFTLIEQRMMVRFVREVLGDMERAWEVIAPIATSVRKTETKVDFVHLVDPGDLVLALVFAVTGQEFAGNIHLCISYLTLEPLKDTLSSKFIREKDEDRVWSTKLRQLLVDTPLTLSAELGRSTLTVQNLLNLQVRDVLKLSTGPEDPVVLNIERVPKYRGLPGVVKGNRAVEIVDLIH